MKSLARQSLAAVLTAALALGSLPSAALAQAAVAAGAGASGSVSPAVALRQMQQWGVFKDDSDVLRQVDAKSFVKPGANKIEISFDGKGTPAIQLAQAQGVGDDRDGGEAHRGGRDHRREQQAEDRIEHAGGDRHARAAGLYRLVSQNTW